MENQEQREALHKALSGQSLMNYRAIMEGFAEKGIVPQDVKPRENVFTFNAWKALGRCVKKGEHGVKVCTWVRTKGKAAEEDSKARKIPWQTTVFHISQTEALQNKGESAASDAAAEINAVVEA